MYARLGVSVKKEKIKNIRGYLHLGDAIRLVHTLDEEEEKETTALLARAEEETAIYEEVQRDSKGVCELEA